MRKILVTMLEDLRNVLVPILILALLAITAFCVMLTIVYTASGFTIPLPDHGYLMLGIGTVVIAMCTVLGLLTWIDSAQTRSRRKQ